MAHAHMLEDRLITQMVIPVSKGTYFNTKWTPAHAPLCAYDMLYHPPDYNPKSARSDRQEPKIIRKNIWTQELRRGIPSTTHFQLGRPTWKLIDIPDKLFVRVQVWQDEDGCEPILLHYLSSHLDLQCYSLSKTTSNSSLNSLITCKRMSTILQFEIKNENPHMRIHNVLEWAVLLNEGKPLCEM